MIPWHYVRNHFILHVQYPSEANHSLYIFDLDEWLTRAKCGTIFTNQNTIMMKRFLFSLLIIPFMSYSQEEVTWLNKGVEAQNNQQYEKALEYYNKSIEINDSYLLAYRNRSIVFFQLENWQGCIDDCKKGISFDSDQYIFYKQMAQLKGEKKYNEAMILSKALDRTSDDKQSPSYIFGHGAMINHANERELADLLAQHDPTNTDYLYACGRAKFDVGGSTYESAIDQFNAILESNPSHKEALLREQLII